MKIESPKHEFELEALEPRLLLSADVGSFDDTGDRQFLESTPSDWPSTAPGEHSLPFPFAANPGSGSLEGGLEDLFADLNEQDGTFPQPVAEVGEVTFHAPLAASAAGPAIVERSVNNGDAQRSHVNSVSVVFSEDVGASLTADDLVLHSRTAGGKINATGLQVAYNAATFTAVWTFPGLSNQSLPPGNYLAYILADSIKNATGQGLSVSVSFDFFVQPGDANADRTANDLDLYRVWQNQLKPDAQRDINEDLSRDGKVDAADVAVIAANYLSRLYAAPTYFQVREISPANGEEMVNLARETIVRFDGPVDPATVTNESFYLIANGQRVPGTVRVSSTEQFATFFYTTALPPSTEVRAVVDGTQIKGRNGANIDGDGDGNAGGLAKADFRTLPLTRIAGTNVFGFVYDSYNKNPDGTNKPVVGATVRVDAFPEANVVTDASGRFELKDMPAPEFFVHIDGTTALNAPPGTIYPSVGKPFHSVPGQTTQLKMDGSPFNIYLPPMAVGDIQPLSASQATEVGFGSAGKAELTAMFPTVDSSMWNRLKVSFPPNSAVDDAGKPATQGIIIPVPPDRLPAPLPIGQSPKLVISIQALGATNFDVPVPVTFPNLDALPAGTKSLIWSFNHDAGRWDVIGTGTVSDDGQTIVSDPGVGVRAPGWHFTDPGGCGEAGGPPPSPAPEPEAIGEPERIYLPLITDEAGAFPVLTFRGPGPDDTNPEVVPAQGCEVLPHVKYNPDELLYVVINIDGPVEQFMKQAEGTTEGIAASNSFTLGAGGEERTFDLTPLSFADVAAKLGAGGETPFKMINGNILFGVAVTVIETRIRSDGSTKTTTRIYYQYRFLDATDANHTDKTMEFPDTLAGVGRRRSLIVRAGNESAPQFETIGDAFHVEGDAALTLVVFAPTRPEQNQTGLLKIFTADGGLSGQILLYGDGEDSQEYYIAVDDPGSSEDLVDALERSFELFMTDAEKAVFGSPVGGTLSFDRSKARTFGSDLLMRVDFLLNPFKTAGVKRVDLPTSNTLLFADFSDSDDAGRIGLGDANILDNENGKYTVEDIHENRHLYSGSEQNFRLSEALNETHGGHVDMYVERYFKDGHEHNPGFNFKRGDLLGSLAKTVAHEIGHNLGLVHTNEFDSSKADMMTQGFDIEGTRRFVVSLNAGKIALGLDWDHSQGQDAVNYYVLWIANGSKDGIEPEDDPNSPPPIPLNDGLLWLVDSTTPSYIDEIDFGVVEVEGPSLTKNFRLFNVGDQPAKLTSLRIEGGDGQFAVTGPADGQVIAPRGEAQVQIGFDPAKTGAFKARLIVSSDALDSKFEVTLAGFGRSAGPRATITALNNNLGGVKVAGGMASNPSLATLTNEGAAPLKITAIKLLEGSASFSLLNVPADLAANPISLEFGQVFTFGAKFDPAAAGLSRAIIEVMTNDPDQPKLRLSAVATGLDSVVYPNWGDDYAAIDLPSRSSSPALHTRSDGDGDFSFVLAPNERYHLRVLDPVTGLIGHSFGMTPASGQGLDLTSNLVFRGSTDVDADFDGLPDDIEFAVGTGATLADSDRDGLDDFTELAQGLDPLDGVGLPTGILASVPLLGPAKDVVVAGGFAYVATGAYGLAVVDVRDFRNPIVLGQLDLPGESVNVAVDGKLGVVAVAAEAGGLHMIDVTDPMQPTLVRTVSVETSAVEIVDGAAYAGVRSAIQVFEVLTGEKLQTLVLEGTRAPTSLAAEGTHLYSDTRRAGTFNVIDISQRGAARVTASLIVGIFSFESKAALTAANGVVYFADAGLTTVDVTDPAAPVILSGADSSFTAHKVVLNGSGLGLVAGGISGLGVYDLSDPANTDVFVRRLDTPGSALGVAVEAGIAFVADDTSGLQVINYLDADVGALAPEITISSPVPDADPATPGVQVAEGASIPVMASVKEDSQVRKVELLANGQVVQVAVSAPFSLAAIAPVLKPGADSVTLQVRATDSAGNVGLSNVLTFKLVDDSLAPVVTGSRPIQSFASDLLLSLAIDFNEPLDAALLNLSGVTLINLGVDGQPGGGDDAPVTGLKLQTREFGKTLFVLAPTSLPPANYRLTLAPVAIADRAGNHPAAAFTLDVTKLPSLLGRTITGVITQTGQGEKFTLNANAGVQVFYDALDDDADDIRVKLLDPDGNIVFEHDSNDDGSQAYTLKVSGEYQLILGENANSSGDFAFRLLDVAVQPEVNFDTEINGALDPGLEADLYRFQGVAGQRLYYNGLSSTPDRQAGVDVIYPEDSNTGIGASDLANDFDIPLTKNGTYLVILARNRSGEPVRVDYSFRLVTPETKTNALTLNTTTSGVLAEPGERHFHTFNSEVGQRVFFDGLQAESNNISVQFYGPGDDFPVGNWDFRFDASRPITLTQPGEYRLEVDATAGSIGAYSFRLLNVADQPDLAFENEVTGTLDPRRESDLFKFVGVSGQRIFFDGISGGFSIEWELFGPDESRLGGLVISSDFAVTLTQDGTHVLRLGGGGEGNPLAYSFRVVRPETQTTALTFAAPVNGTLTKPGDTHEYTFTGTIGQRLYYDALEADTDVFEANLLTPSGKELFLVSDSDTNPKPFTLTEAGTYRLAIGGAQDKSGGFSFRLLEVAEQTELTLGGTLNGTLNPRLQGAVFRYNGKTGEKLHFDALAGGSAIAWDFYDPDNRNLGGVSLSQDFDVTLTADGIYVLVLEAVGAGNPIDYSFSVTAAQASSATRPQLILQSEEVPNAPLSGPAAVPVVAARLIDEGAAQQSRVTSLLFLFNENVGASRHSLSYRLTKAFVTSRALAAPAP